MAKKVNTALIASGSGTDADSIMKAYAAGFISNINLKSLVSTKSGASCPDKAEALGAPTDIIIGILEEAVSKESVDDAASKLQQIVLPNEWPMLPIAVQMAAQKIIDIKEVKT